MILWADIESTGLDETRHELLEVALLATSDHLTPLDDGVSVALGCDQGVTTLMDPIVLDMHTRSGLLSDIAASDHTRDSAQTVLTDYLNRFDLGVVDRAPLAGSNVKFDRRWLEHWMPTVVERVDYHDICVSTVKETCKRFFPGAFRTTPRKQHQHRALADIHESIGEYRHYVTALGATTFAPA